MRADGSSSQPAPPGSTITCRNLNGQVINKGFEVSINALYFPNQGNGNCDNDYVFYRLSDVILMKAEAQLRSSNAVGALTIVNYIRVNRGASLLASLTLDNLVVERGRELDLENVRRNDLIRFGKFLTPWQEKQ
jgi:hypothetical protein